MRTLITLPEKPERQYTMRAGSTGDHIAAAAVTRQRLT
jgi:hypothetical protein